jgi:hypothetical protein
MNFFATLTTLEEILLEAVDDWKQDATGGIGRSMDTVRTRNSASQGSCMRFIRPISKLTGLYENVPLVLPTEIATRAT